MVAASTLRPETAEPGDHRIGRPTLPVGRSIELPGRGTTFVREVAGPRADAPVVFLLHGWTVTAALNWFPAYGPLSEHARVISLDHRGHGQGIRTRRAFRLEDAADDVVALADELGIERFVVAGYSMGGPISQLVWRRHPDRVDGLVLAATFARSSRRSHERVAMRGLRQLGRASRLAPRRRQIDMFTRAMIAGGSRPSERPSWMVSEVRSGSVPMMMEAGGAIADFDSRAWLGEVDVPTGVFITSHDGIVPPDRQHRMAALLTHAEIRRAPLDHDGCVTSPSLFIPGFVDLVRHAADC
ncbi:MAG: alpha/beta fold hydrolase [Acidimicrobiales bacterium]|nr:alpha/beta fold hydrolase [Acidimicrobiales bacterium]